MSGKKETETVITITLTTKDILDAFPTIDQAKVASVFWDSTKAELSIQLSPAKTEEVLP